MASNEKEWSQVIVRNSNGEVILDWTRPFLGELTTRSENGRIVIRKEGMFGEEEYTVSNNDSIETKR